MGLVGLVGRYRGGTCNFSVIACVKRGREPELLSVGGHRAPTTGRLSMTNRTSRPLATTRSSAVERATFGQVPARLMPRCRFRKAAASSGGTTHHRQITAIRHVPTAVARVCQADRAAATAGAAFPAVERLGIQQAWVSAGTSVLAIRCVAEVNTGRFVDQQRARVLVAVSAQPVGTRRVSGPSQTGPHVTHMGRLFGKFRR